MKDWQPGDRVRIYLDWRHGGGRGHFAAAWFTGTVREVNPPGLPPGVRVDLDESVKGLRDCFATHAELEPIDPDALGALGLRQPYDLNGHEIVESGWEHECG